MRKKPIQLIKVVQQRPHKLEIVNYNFEQRYLALGSLQRVSEATVGEIVFFGESNNEFLGRLWWDDIAVAIERLNLITWIMKEVLLNEVD